MAAAAAAGKKRTAMSANIRTRVGRMAAVARRTVRDPRDEPRFDPGFPPAQGLYDPARDAMLLLGTLASPAYFVILILPPQWPRM